MTDVAISGLPALTPVPSTAIVPVVSGGTTSKGTVADVVKGGGALLADGTVPATANLNLATHKLVGVSPGTAGTDGVNKTQLDAAVLADGTRAYTGDQSFGTHKATNLANGGSGTQEAATVAQTEALIAASTSNVADWKQSVRAATTAALPANTRVGSVLTANANGALAAQDTVTLIVGDRLLVKNEATGANNGIYTVTALGSGGAPWSLTRAADADASAEVTCGMICEIEEGTLNGPDPTTGAKFYTLTTANPITVNTTALTFKQLSTLAADGTSITSSGGTLSRAALTGDVTASAGSNATTIAAGAVTNTKIANGTIDVTTKITGVVPVPNGGSAPGVSGGNLTNANVTKSIADGTDFFLPTNTLGTSNKTVTLDRTTGTPQPGEKMRYFISSQAGFTYTIQNDNSAGGLTSAITVAAGEKWLIIAEYMGTDWLVQRDIRLA